MRRDGEHAAISILRARINRTGVIAFSEGISDPAGAGSRTRSGGGAGVRRRAQRTGVVRVEFYSGKLGSVKR